MTLYYYGSKTVKYATEETYFTDIRELIQASKITQYNTIILQPGDGTRYEIRTVIGKGLLLCYMNAGRCASFPDQYIPASYLAEKLNISNRYSVTILTDVVNMLLGYETNFYNWKEAKPDDN